MESQKEYKGLECWTCRFWESTYSVIIKGKIEVTHGKCLYANGVIDDISPICMKYQKIKVKEK